MSKKEVLVSHYAGLSADKILKELKTDIHGLSYFQAKTRLEEYGPNTLAEKKSTIITQVLVQFKSPLIWILFAAAGLSNYFGQSLNAAIILVMILLSITVNFFQAYTSEKAVDKLKEIIKTTATVIRDGKQKEIILEQIVPGDIIILNPGKLVPADSRIIESKGLYINQSALTGESAPAEKTTSRQNNIVYLGTNVVSGSAIAVVLTTGVNTEYGKISTQITTTPPLTEFEKGIGKFSYLILKAIFVLVIIIFFLNTLKRQNIYDSIMFAIAIAVGITPELLPAIMSINMAKGSLNMAKKGAIVKRLSAIPNFGSMDVLCTDKTGTLTQDKIKLVKYVDANGKHSDEVLKHAYLNSYYHTGIVNPLDTAITTFRKENITGYKKIDEIPFDFSRRKMSVVVQKSGKRTLITKGAPEEIFKSCKKVPSYAIKQYEQFSKEGYRVLAIAVKTVRKQKQYTKKEEKTMKFLGFTTFLDPPKKDARAHLRELEKMSVEVKVITGDNELVTKKICDELGLEIKGILLGDELNKITDDALRVRVEKTTIFARVSPNQKNRVITALRANGHVVGYLGDGINDAPSMKTADVGISVNSAVDIAKESADIVLTHKCLEVLKDGVIEGRKTFGNTIKYITMGLSSNFGNMFSVIGAVLYVPFLPMLPIQIMLNNVIYDFSQVTIPTDNVDKEYVQKPRRWNMQYIKRFMWTFGPISSIFDLITYYVLYGIFHVPAAVFQTGWFMESLATQTLVIHIIRTRKTPFIGSMPSKYLLISTFVCLAIGWMLPYVKIGQIFGFSPLPLKIVLIIAGIVMTYLVTVELIKRRFYKKYDL